MDVGEDGYEFWHLNDIRPEDAQITKKRYSAFIQGSSDIERHLRDRGIDTLLITGTATNVCCESTARDAMMLNFKVVMVADGLATHTDEEHNADIVEFLRPVRRRADDRRGFAIARPWRAEEGGSLSRGGGFLHRPQI